MKLKWSQFKSIVDSQILDITMVEESDAYILFSSNGSLEFECRLLKDITADVGEFEDDYKSSCNVPCLNKVTPAAPLNEYELKPYGIMHKHIDSSGYVYDITLSNKDENNYDYSCTVDPEYYDCIWGSYGQLRSGVLSVDTENNTLETFYDDLDNGTYKISKTIDIDYQLPTGEHSVFYLWGMFFTAKDYADDDLARLQIVDKDGLGVLAGWYTQEEFEAIGSLYVVKEYDECWVDQMNKLVYIKTPDGAPGEIPAGLYLRIKYYPKDETKTDIKLWIDYSITIKS